jgi:hypothetical protein
MFRDEMNKRRTCYKDQRKIKDLLFQEIEHDKTQLRIVENKTDRSPKAKVMHFPFKSLAGITKAKIKSNLQNIKFIAIDTDSAAHPHNAIYFTIETGNSNYKSRISKSITNPKWEDIFNINILDELSTVNFRVYS